MRRQHLTTRVPAAAALDVVSRLNGLHAQVMSSAELTLHARVDGLSADAVGRWLWEERRLIKTWAVRGTLHLLPAAEMPVWIAALSTYRHFEKPSWQRAFVPLDQLQQIIAACGEVLDGALLTREELAQAVAARTGVAELGEAVRSSWGAMLKPAAFRGQLCFAPSDGQLVRFTRPDRWLAPTIGPWPELDPQEALLTLLRRYLTVQGPATREDIARWFALPPAQVGKLLRALGDEILAVDVQGTSGWGLAELVVADVEAAPPPDAQPVVRLLPAFDQYVVSGPRNVEAVLPATKKDRVFRPQGWLSPVLLVDGRIEGVWRHERRGSRLTLTIEPFDAQPVEIRTAAEQEAERIAEFLGGVLELGWI
jgi:uncharacterized protein YcaQ